MWIFEEKSWEKQRKVNISTVLTPIEKFPIASNAICFCHWTRSNQPLSAMGVRRLLLRCILVANHQSACKRVLLVSWSFPCCNKWEQRWDVKERSNTQSRPWWGPVSASSVLPPSSQPLSTATWESLFSMAFQTYNLSHFGFHNTSICIWVLLLCKLLNDRFLQF